MASFDLNTTDLRQELTSVQSDYRTTNSMLARAKRTGSKADVRELTRAKNRISKKLDTLKNQLGSQSSFE
jgi:hypothetical protein